MTREMSRPRAPGGEPGPPDVAQLVGRAASGDQSAWNELVDRFSGLVWSICRAHRLNTADAADVFQQTWLRLLEHLDAIEDPARLRGWLGTTCRHECLRVLRRSRRTQPIGDDRVLDRHVGHLAGPEQPCLVADRNASLWRAFGRLSERCQRILRVLVVEPEDGPPSYALAATALGIPAGSLGPSRARCLTHLRELLGKEGISGIAPDS
jgi:RNA polymerase sigma factor (sigma-70 family)